MGGRESALGWTQEECLHSLVRKAGFEDRVDDALLRSIRLTRYQSSKCTLTYEQWQALRARRADLPSHSRA